MNNHLRMVCESHLVVIVRLIQISTGPMFPQLPINVQRVLTGAEQTHGGLRLGITNMGDTTFTTAWLETMPWFIQFFLHTMELRVDNQKRGKYEYSALFSLYLTAPFLNNRRPSIALGICSTTRRPSSCLHARGRSFRTATHHA
jgi:hypothetical protein